MLLQAVALVEAKKHAAHACLAFAAAATWLAHLRCWTPCHLQVTRPHAACISICLQAEEGDTYGVKKIRDKSSWQVGAAQWQVGAACALYIACLCCGLEDPRQVQLAGGCCRRPLHCMPLLWFGRSATSRVGRWAPHASSTPHAFAVVWQPCSRVVCARQPRRPHALFGPPATAHACCRLPSSPAPAASVPSLPPVPSLPLLQQILKMSFTGEALSYCMSTIYTITVSEAAAQLAAQVAARQLWGDDVCARLHSCLRPRY